MTMFTVLRALVLGVIFGLFATPTLLVAEPLAMPSTTVLVWLSVAANVFVLGYHYTQPAHPKFTMLPRRRAVLLAHILSGSVELVAGLVAFVQPGHRLAGGVMAATALLVHVPSALAQTPIVFGSRALMVPAYLLCIAMHAACAVRLALDPASHGWATNTFLVFNVYAWVRVYFLAFERLELFRANQYTLAVLAAGSTLVPAVFGPLAFLFVATFVGADVLLHRVLGDRAAGDFAERIRERARDAYVHPDLAAGSAGQSDPAGVRRAFAALDADGDGVLTRVELEGELARRGVPTELVRALLERHVVADTVSLDIFERHFWSIGAVRARGFRRDKVLDAAARARAIFCLMDHDCDDRISRLELQLLLLEWGLPASEVDRYFDACDRDRDGVVSFDEFFTSMSPVWSFLSRELDSRSVPSG
jgi:Ca2+-binding EF-hand superfamily protein